jgi:hypothetical protein
MPPISTRNAGPPREGDAIGKGDGGDREGAQVDLALEGDAEVDIDVDVNVDDHVDDVTERMDVPETEPPPRAVSPAPQVLPPAPARQVRSRKETLSSPIPALLAASMGSVEEGSATSSHSIPTWLGGEETSRLEPSARRSLLAREGGGPRRAAGGPGARADADDDADEYVVEIDPRDPGATGAK